ncbi:uncharacterized protein KGF55_000832 [Candida pseudojiufengensis]|uniref:uncharacterized protein n=1 Tax=Candida pseudojiufengensis TaxID=497109 RepID=UPI0022247370|nr:uncharacterized protein KGF55_000832 [Candida pseudojiufengensis]KAI5966523.1 hypothetical protein KGF55_000832 [Candida pseudojiufengensis]
MQLIQFFVVFILAFGSLAHTVPGLSSLKSQYLAKREFNDVAENIFRNLPREEIDFINYHLQNLTNYNSTKCDTCKHRLRYARSLVDELPDKQHLVVLMLYKYCVNTNYNSASCGYNEFFINTGSYNNDSFNDTPDSNIGAFTNVHIFDNDFLRVIKNFDIESEIDLEYYCFFKDKESCDLPETPDVEELFNISNWWPAKQPKHYQQPIYKNNSEKFNVIHVTDFHIQPAYETGQEANCSSVPCGIKWSYSKKLPGKEYNFTEYYTNLNPTFKDFNFSFYPDARYDDLEYIKGDYYDFPKYRGWNFVNSPATPFGAYLSDSPPLLMNSSLAHIKKMNQENNLNFEYAIFTGDLYNHDSTHGSREETIADETLAFNLMKDYFGNITVLPSLGNRFNSVLTRILHDDFPYSQLPPLHLNNDTESDHYHYNVEKMAELWINNEWFDKKDENDLKRHYTGFSYVTKRGLKVIALNSNAYYDGNLYAFLDQTTNPDLFGNWKFLVDELIESESKDQRVWIMFHVPPNNFDVLPIASRIFGTIVERFSPYTISAIFSGIHRDQFSILYSGNSTADEAQEKDALLVNYVSQSVTPFTSFNPSWRYYEVENESFNIINSNNYYLQLNGTFNNGGEEPEWEFEYSARDLYDPDHTWPTNAPLNATFWHRYVAARLWNTSDTAFNQKFMDYKYRKSPLTPVCTTPKEKKLARVCYNDNNCFLNFYSDNNIKCQKEPIK